MKASVIHLDLLAVAAADGGLTIIDHNSVELEILQAKLKVEQIFRKMNGAFCLGKV